MSHNNRTTSTTQVQPELIIHGVDHDVFEGMDVRGLAFEFDETPTPAGRKALVAAVVTLPEPERSIVAKLHRTNRPLTHEQLGHELGCSTHEVRCGHLQAMRMLQHAIDAAALLHP